MFGYLRNSFFPSFKNVGRIILGGFFLAAGVQAAMGFQQFLGNVQNLNLPFPQALALIAIGLKILGGVSVTMNLKADWGRWILIFFTTIVTFLMHNPIRDPGQMINFGKNLAIIGGLLLIE